MPKPQVEKNDGIELRCSYDKCEMCSLFEHCETCYDETCFFENCNRFCGRCAVSCHSNPDPYFEEVDLLKLKVKETSGLDFSPGWFPTVRKNELLKKLKLKAVAVKFEEIYNFKSELMRTLDIHDFLELPQSTKIIITFNVPDRILEKLWLTFQSRSFRLIIKKLKTDYICTPNFSNYFDTPRYQYWRNIWRSVEMTNELIDSGYRVIFDISSPVPATHRFYLRLIKKSSCKALTFNCQTIRLNRYKKLAYERFAYFHKGLDKSIPFIINGLTSVRESLPIYKACRGRSLYFTSTSPYLKAICQQSLTSHRRISEKPLELLNLYFSKLQKVHDAR